MEDDAGDYGLGVGMDDGLFEPTRERESSGQNVDHAETEAKRHNFWLAKRKKQRERVKDNKEKLTKEEKTNKYRTQQKWRDMPISQIQFNYPRVCLDASYESFLTEKEIASVGSQLMYTYGFNKRTERPLELHITSFGGKLESRMSEFDGFNSWKVYIHKTAFHEEFEKEKIVYLSPESENVLEDVDDDTVYIVGAIADHNRLKGLSANTAESVGIESARLPIDQYLSEVPNVSLNINHVVEILTNYKITKDWREALMKSVPTRKAYQKTTQE